MPGAAAYGAAPDILLIADAPSTRACIAAEAAGYRISAMLDQQAGMERLCEAGAPERLLLTLDSAADFALLDRIEMRAREGRLRAAITMPFDLVDDVSAHVEDPAVSLLCAPDNASLAATLALMDSREAEGVREIAAEEAERLRNLSDEAARIARALAEMASPQRTGFADGRTGFSAEPGDPVPGGGDPVIEPGDIRRIIRARRMRDRHLGAELFADPAWDMLLDLMAARLEGGAVAVSSLCIAAAVPPTTALRWIGLLTRQGLLDRQSDPRDGRRIFLGLSDGAADAMLRYFAAVKAAGLVTL